MEFLVVGGIILLVGTGMLRRWKRQKFERHNDLGDHLGDHIDESEWEHGE